MSEGGPKIFRANNHSLFDPGWELVTEEQKETTRRAVALLHPDAQVVSVHKPKNRLEFSSSNLLVALSREIADEKMVVLKEHTRFPKELKSLEVVNRFTEHLFKNGSPVTLPLGVPQRSGEHYWESFPFVDGTGFRGTAPQLGTIATAFASFHKGLAEYPHQEDFLNKDQVETHLTAWTPEGFQSKVFAFAEQEYETTIEKYKNDSKKTNLTQEDLDALTKLIPWSVAIHDNRQFIERLIQDVTLKQKLIAASSVQPIHGDFHPHEVIMREDDSVATFTALGKVTMGPRAEDLGMATHRIVREYAVKQKEEKDRPWQETVPEGVAIFLDAYQAVNPLPPEEMALMTLHAQNRQLEKLYGRGKDNNNRKPGDSRAVGKWLELAHELSVIDEAVATYQKGLQERSKNP